MTSTGTASQTTCKKTVIPRAEHCVSRRHISENALKVLYRLRDAGYETYLVGGVVRDLLLGLEPKDFDVATDASPDEVKALFRNCRLIGRRFRLAHILFGREVIEVATFRASHRDSDDGRVDDDGRILRDNVFGNVEEDALRRDFTVNALYYDIRDFSIVDFVGAMADIQARRLRLIGDPQTRYTEDPVRMLRAARFAAKLGFELDSASAAPIHQLGPLLRDIPPARLFEEVLKLLQTGHGAQSLEQLWHFDLLRYLFPAADRRIRAEDSYAARLIMRALDNTDERIAAGKSVTPSFLFAAFLWPDVHERAAALEADGEPPIPAIQQAADEVVDEQLKYTSLPRRFSLPMREIWTLQPRLQQYTGQRALRTLSHPRFRAGYDFLCLRAEAGEPLTDCARWWTEIQEKDEDTQITMARKAGSSSRRRRGPRRRRAASGD